MRYLLFTLTALLLLGLIACENNTTGIDQNSSNALQQENSEAIKAVLEDSIDIFYEAIDDETEANMLTDEPNWLGGGSLPKTAAIKTRFGRIFRRPVEHSIEIVYDTDTTATASVYSKILGKFVVLKVERNTDTTSINRFEKEMVHEVERIVHLKKIRETDNPRRNWKIVDISIKDGASPDHTVEIVELEVIPEGQDPVVIENPLEYFMNGINMFTFPRLTDVKLRVKVRNSSSAPIVYPEGTQATENVRLHFGRNRKGHFGRSKLEWVGQDDLGNNIYEGKWTIRQFRGMHHAVIDVIDNGTILSNDEQTYPYDSNTWAMPYRVTPF